MVGHGFLYGATGFVGMCAVGETAVGRELENLTEVARELRPLNVAFYSRFF